MPMPAAVSLALSFIQSGDSTIADLKVAANVVSKFFKYVPHTQ